MQGAGDYKDKAGCCYFITIKTVDCIDVFVRPVYKQVIVHTLNHFIETKGLTVYAWCLMTHHLHLLVQVKQGTSIAELEKEYKSFTAAKILQAIDTEPPVRKDWILGRFKNVGRIPGLLKSYRVWEDGNPPLQLDLTNTCLLLEYFDLIHHNPVGNKIVDLAGEYLYSSARDYTGIKGLVNIEKIPAIEQQLAATETMNGTFLVKYIRN